MLAYDYPILGLFWTMLWLFLWIAWLMLLFKVIFDIFRSHDMGGWGKALWAIFVVVVPFLGVLVYLIARGDSMRERDVADMKAQQEAMNTYIQQAASGGTSAADELTKLHDLKERGVITDAEYQQQKVKLLA
jgi:ABC-type multidrug transport system fused ATPase/permease subunit